LTAEERSARPFIVRRGERDPIWSLGGHFSLKLGSADAPDAFALVESVAFRTTEPPLHVHTREHEAWYVLDGQMTFVVGDDEFVAKSGDFVFAPRGLPHSFTVDVEPTRVLVFATPAGFEHFAGELGVPAQSESPPADLALPDPAQLGPIGAKYGIDVVGPPLRVMRG
jgi:mannose-6-phosphate isomerase-like protein (cupin superfamily)